MKGVIDNNYQIVPKQIKLGLILQYKNNLGWLRDTIQFGSDFNLLINSRGDFNKQFVGNWKKCKNTQTKLHNLGEEFWKQNMKQI